jgi:hypothetical protein
MFKSTIRNFVFVILVLSAQAFAQQLSIETGDLTLSIGRVEVELTATGGTGSGYAWSVIDGTLPPGVLLRTDTPYWFNPSTTAGLIGVATAPGTYNFTLRVTDSLANVATRPVTMTITRLVVTSDSQFADASVGVFYSKTITTAGATGPVSFNLPSGQYLPDGLTLDSETGVLSGTPTSTDPCSFWVNISDSTGTIARNFQFFISALRIVSPTSLPTATQGQPYSQTFSVAGGTPPYTFRLMNGTIASGLSLDASGILSGTPCCAYHSGFTIEIIDSAQASLRKHYRLGVIGVPPNPPDIGYDYFDDATLGEHYISNIWAGGGTPPYTWSIPAGTPPPGMDVYIPDDNFDAAGFVGTPIELGTYAFTIQVADSSIPALTRSRSATVRISPLALDSLPDGTLGVSYSQRIYALGGVPPYTFEKTAGNLPSGLSLDSNTGLISGTPQENGYLGFRIRVTDSAGTPNTLNRNISIGINTDSPNMINIGGHELGPVMVNQYCSLNVLAWGGSGTYNWNLESGSSLPPGLTIAQFTSPSVQLSGTPTTVGIYSFALRAVDVTNPAIFGVRVFRIMVTPLQLTVSTNLPWGNVGSTYSTPLTVSGNTGSVTWSIEPGYSLPDGMTLLPNGELRGTPTSPGRFWIRLRVTDAGSGTYTSWGFSVEIYPAGEFPPVVINTGSNFGIWNIGKVQAELSASGGNGTYTWSLVSGTLPPGISIRADKPSWFSTQASAGLIGVATTRGTYIFMLQVTSGSATETREFSMKIVNPTIFDISGLPEAHVGESYSYIFTSTTANPVWSSSPGNPLPPGLTLNTNTGELYGTPSTAGTYNFSITDGSEAGSRGFNINVRKMWITNPRILPNATQGVPYSVSFATAGSVGNVTWNTGGTPSGLTLLPNGTLTGTPTSGGTNSFNITATDSNSQSYQTTFYLQIVADPPPLLQLSGGTSNDITLGDNVGIGFNVNGGTAPYTWSASGIPPGMSLIQGPPLVQGFGASISGIPLSVDSYNVTVSVTDSSSPAKSTSQTFVFNVVALGRNSNDVPSNPLRTLGGTLPYTWEVVSDTFPPAWMLPAGLTLNPSTGMISGSPLERAFKCPQIKVTDSAANAYLANYCMFTGWSTVGVQDWIANMGSATVNQSFTYYLFASGAPSYIWSVESGSALPPGLNLNAGGFLYGTPTTAGIYKFLIRAADSANPSNYGTKQLMLNVTPLTVSTNINWANVGTPITITPTVNGNAGPVTWSLALGNTLPPGLTLNESTGAISGTPTSTGQYNFTLKLTDAVGGTWRTIGINLPICPAGEAPFLSLGPNILGRIVNTLDDVRGNPPRTYSYAPEATPIPGTRIQTGPPIYPLLGTTTAGSLLGIVTNPGTYNTTLRVTDSQNQQFYRGIRLTVSPLMPLTHFNLTRATVGVPYSFSLKFSGGTPPYTLSPVWLPMPPGLAMTSAGLITGTPTIAGSYVLFFKITDANNNSITLPGVIEVTPFQINTPSELPHGTVNSSYSQMLSASANGVSWSISDGGLPAGLSMNSSGVIAGTPTSTATTSFTVKATDSDGRNSYKTFSLAIWSATQQPLSIISSGWLEAPIGYFNTKNLEASGGVPPYTWSIESGSALPSWADLFTGSETSCYQCAPGFGYLNIVPTAVGDFTFTIRVTDSTANYISQIFTIHSAPIAIEYTDLPVSGMPLNYGQPYLQAMLGIGGTGSYTWNAEGTLPPGLSLSLDGTVSGIPEETGTFSTPIRITDGNNATIVRTVNFNISSGMEATLRIDTGSNLGDFDQGSIFNRDFQSSGSPLSTPNYVFSSVGSLPPGCSLTKTTAPARMTCSIASVGTYNFTLRVQDAAGNFGVKLFILRVLTPNVFFTNSSLNSAATGVPFSQPIIAFGPGGTWSLEPGNSLPPGITLAADGTLNGTPTAPGNYNFMIRLTDAYGRISRQIFRMTVADLSISDPPVLPHAILGEPYSYTFTAQGGGPNKTWSLSSGSLPTGITLSSNGVLSGTPTAFVTENTFSIQVSDGGTYAFTKMFVLVARLKYSLLLSGPRKLPDATVGASYQNNLSNTGIPPYTWSIVQGSLPPGLNLIPGSDLYPRVSPLATVIAGVPTTAGSYTFTMRLTDATGASSQRTISLKVSPLRLQSNFSFLTYGSAFNQTLTVLGGTAPYSYTIVSGGLPWLTLSPDGLLSGTPADTGFYITTVRITDSLGNSADRDLWILVSGPTNPNILVVPFSAPANPSVLPSISLGDLLTMNLLHYNGTSPYTVSLESGNLPPGIVFSYNPELNVNALVGRPTATGSYTFKVRSQDSSTPPNIGYKVITLKVSPIQILPPPTVWSAITGQPVNLQYTAFGGTPPYNFSSVVGGFLPLGLTLNQDGSITGTTSESGPFSFQFRVTDSAGNDLQYSGNLRVYPAEHPIPPLEVKPYAWWEDGISKSQPTLDASVDSSLLLKPILVSGAPPYSLTVLSGQLPPGFTLVNGSGLTGPYVTGIPTSAGKYNYNLNLADSAGRNTDLYTSTKVSLLSLSPNLLPPATANVPYSVTLVPAGGQAPYSLQQQWFTTYTPFPAMPPGLSLNGTTLSGTPTVPGIFKIAFKLRDNSGEELVRLFTLYIESTDLPLKALRTSPTNVQATFVYGSTPDLIPINIESGITPVNFTAAFAGIPGATLNITSGTTPQAINLGIPSGLAVDTYYGVIEIQSPQSPNTPLALSVVVKIIPQPPCTYAVTTASATIKASGDSSSFGINTASYCGWSASASHSWITLTSSESGSGSGTVNYSVSSNPDPSPRTGSITVNGQTHTITQFGSDCAYTINPSEASVQSSGGSGAFTVNASSPACPWTASTSDTWIEITSGSGSGTGDVIINVQPKTNYGSRTGTVTVQGLSLTVHQSGTDCTVNLASGGADFTSGGGTGSVAVTTNGCSYSTVSPPSWITLTSGASGSNSGTLEYSIAPNSTTQMRSHTLIIGGQPYSITQAGMECSFTVNVSTTLFGSSSGSGTISVIPNGSNCSWTSFSGSNFLRITSGWGGRGNGTVAFSLFANTSSISRDGTIIVAGQMVPITQSGVACSYDLRSSSGNMPSIGGLGSAGIVAPDGCAWTASSNQPWLSLNSSSGTGTSEIYYVAQPNTSTAERGATIDIQGQAYTVTQAGVPCSYTLGSSTATVGPFGNQGDPGSFTFSPSMPECSDSAVSYSNWIAVTTDASAGKVTFVAEPNPLTSERSSIIQLGNQVFTVKQTAANCSFSLNAYGALFSRNGGSGDILASASALGCPPAVGAISPEITLGTLTKDDSTKIWTQPYSVPVYDSFNLWIRVLQISFSGEVFTIKQTSW